MPTAEVVSETGALTPWLDRWDALADGLGAPYSSPDWMLSWWNHAAPGGARLQVVLITDAEDLLGVVPLFVERRAGFNRYRLLASGMYTPVQPLAHAGGEKVVAAAAAAALGEADVGRIDLEAVPASEPVCRALTQTWPRGTWHRTHYQRAAPVLRMRHTSFEDWLSSRSSNFRQQMRRSKRKLEQKGAVFRLTRTRDDLERDLSEFRRLHHGRWAEKGGSGVLAPPTERMIEEAARRLLARGRLRLWNVDVGDVTISSHLLVSAGDRLSYWLGGFDPAWGTHHPSLLTLLTALEEAWSSGHSVFDLGLGDQGYKDRFADDRDPVRWATIVPRGGRFYPVARLELLPRQVRRSVSERLSESTKDRLRTIAGRIRRR